MGSEEQNTPVRTRFAPSPTGHLHIGGARTALFNFLFARHHRGTFILRIEDTDRERSTEESVQALIQDLSWLGLAWDEGPFYQSQRLPLYREHADRLLAEGKAYRCYCPPEEIEAKRKAAMARGAKPMYDRTCRDRTDRPDRPFVVRFRAPLEGEIVVPDLIKGEVRFDNRELDDLVLVRSDGTPTYNFCAAVDDALMNVTHIIRGEDHLANTPKQIHIYRAFGYREPRFAHVPLILGTDRARLSKRHGATSVGAYREAGYLPQGLVNYLARLGWSFGDQELFTLDELIEKFSLERVGTSAGVFNPEKLEWVNFQHMKRLSPAELAEAVRPFIEKRGWPVPEPERLERIVASLQERARTLVELVDRARFFLCDEIEIEPAARKVLDKTDPTVLETLREELARLPSWELGVIQEAFQRVLDRTGLKLGKVAQPARAALTGSTVSPGIFEVAEALGRQRTLERLDRALALVRAKAGSSGNGRE